jgi:ribosomal protein S1
MKFRSHQELDVTVIAVAPVGAKVEVDGETGFIDQVKHPSWWDENTAAPKVGDRLHVVVLDASREPPRFSALQRDIEIARQLRDTDT